jgi:hypothetical protein
LVSDLGSPDFPTRINAERTLCEVGDAIRLDLEKAHQREQDLETRVRLNRILTRLRLLSQEQIRDIRAVLVLEARGTPQARELLRRLAGGAPQARLTCEARQALARLMLDGKREVDRSGFGR